jgi:hypothetical protein
MKAMALLFDERKAIDLLKGRFTCADDAMATFGIKDGEDLKKRFGSARDWRRRSGSLVIIHGV